MTEQEQLARVLYTCVWENGLAWEETSPLVRNMYAEKARKVLASNWMKTHDANILGTTETDNPTDGEPLTVVTTIRKEQPSGLKALFRKVS